MFRPGRLLTLGVLAFLIYMGFYAVPASGPDVDDFDPEAVARHEAAAWQAAGVREELSTFVNCVLYQRELHRLSWFRAAESGMALSRALGQFPHMTSRFERILPQLEEVAAVERIWRAAEFEPRVVARSQLNWMVASRNPRQADNAQHSVSEMAVEYGLRFGIHPEFMFPAAADRVEAFQLILAQNAAAPDWDVTTRLLARSYTTLKSTLARARDAE